MNISIAWLREWINPKVTDEALAERLTMAGLEVDGLKTVAPYFEKIIIGKILTCEKHPDADKLNVCQVEVGIDKPLSIICGASNVKKGLCVIVATIGSKLPNGLKIKKAKLRGVDSFGMICSESELGLVSTSEGICELPEGAPIGQDIREYLDLDDKIIELDITPNRGDCFSILGVARELSANYDLPFKQPVAQIEASTECAVNAQVLNTQACPKYLIRTIKNLNNATQTPEWMARKLVRSNIALHSPVVDITNYVLLELGQPMHAFDLQKIIGNIEVRQANSGEVITLLNEQVVDLNTNTLIIADSKKPLAIAGIMGGIESATQAESVDICLESAFFEPVALAGKARDYGLHTESSLRFERGVDFELCTQALERATELILEICGGEASKVDVCFDKNALPELSPIDITQSKIQKILGFKIPSTWIEQKFTSLQFKIVSKTQDSWSIVPPSFRFDIRIPADLIEELARLYGYDKLPVQKMTLNTDVKPNKEALIDKNTFNEILINRGYQEVITYSFISEKYHQLVAGQAKMIKLANPISSDMSVMRTSLIAGLLQTFEADQRRGHSNVRLFEAGLCFEGIKAEQQQQKIAGLISGNRFANQWADPSRALDFFDIKSDVEALLSPSRQNYTFMDFEHPVLQKGQSAQILKEGQIVGFLGALTPKVQSKLSLPKTYLFELDLHAICLGKISQFQSFSSYQKNERDIALLVDKDLPVQVLLASIKSLNQPNLIEVKVFDVYQGENIASNKKSIALNLSYQSLESTLKDEEVNTYIQEVLNIVQQKYNAELR
jgi:phenylalanyl-tRNA synthetase beta chain